MIHMAATREGWRRQDEGEDGMGEGRGREGGWNGMGEGGWVGGGWQGSGWPKSQVTSLD